MLFSSFKRTFAILAILIMILSIPVLLVQIKSQQDIRQRASERSNHLANCQTTRDNCNARCNQSRDIENNSCNQSYGNPCKSNCWEQYPDDETNVNNCITVCDNNHTDCYDAAQNQFDLCTDGTQADESCLSQYTLCVQNAPAEPVPTTPPTQAPEPTSGQNIIYCKDDSDQRTFPPSSKKYECAKPKTQGSCNPDAGLGYPFVCQENGTWAQYNNNNPECTTQCKPDQTTSPTVGNYSLDVGQTCTDHPQCKYNNEGKTQCTDAGGVKKCRWTPGNGPDSQRCCTNDSQCSSLNQYCDGTFTSNDQNQPCTVSTYCKARAGNGGTTTGSLDVGQTCTDHPQCKYNDQGKTQCTDVGGVKKCRWTPGNGSNPTCCTNDTQCPSGQVCNGTLTSNNQSQSCTVNTYCVAGGSALPTSPQPTTPQPTVAPGEKVFKFEVAMMGISNVANTNNNPNHQTRSDFTVKVFNNNNQEVKQVTNTSLTYDRATGTYKGNINVGTLNAETYYAKIKFGNTLLKQTPLITVSTNVAEYQVIKLDLISGDIDGNNEIGASDFNIIISCARNQSCSDEQKFRSDLDDDGIVDIRKDPNILQKALWLSRRQGD